ncbi:MAG TPA: hypothetical protein VKC63_03540 [Solirubrobacterales bacterium]|nr:hypothetical protein [Solirubrobacterales bacterium]
MKPRAPAESAAAASPAELTLGSRRAKGETSRAAAALLDHSQVLGLVPAGNAERKDHRTTPKRLDIAELFVSRARAAIDIGAGVRVNVERLDPLSPKSSELIPDDRGDAQRASLDPCTPFVQP